MPSTLSILHSPKYTAHFTTNLTDNNKTSNNKNKNNIVLEQKYETLWAVIESQSTVFKAFIIELANNSLTHSTKITEKQASLDHFGKWSESNIPFVPCSTQSNLELTTSEEFRDEPSFTTLRDELRVHISDFQKQATGTMRKWAVQEITLLNIKWWNKLLPLIFSILEGLIHQQLLLQLKPHWPNVTKKHLTLFLLLMYLDEIETHNKQMS